MKHSDSSSSSGANIVSLWGHKELQEVSALRELRDYWESLRSGRLVPLRSEIDPREIASTLKYGFILERIQPGAVRFRLAGQHLSDLMGMEVRGMPIRSFISPVSRSKFGALLERVFVDTEIHEYHLKSDDGVQSVLSARLLILPLKSDNGIVDRAIGCFVSEGAVGLAPRRFRVVTTKVTSLANGTQTQEMMNDYPKTPNDRVAELAEAPLDYLPEPRPKLRLIVSDT